MALRKKKDEADRQLAEVGESFLISTKGANGSVTFTATGLEREFRKIVGRNDREFLPYQAIVSVGHDRKGMRFDRVTIRTAAGETEWRVINDAEKFVNTLQSAIANGSLKSVSSASPLAESHAPPPTAPSMTPLPPGTAAGWHADPSDRHEMRYWDGDRWTDDVSDDGSVSKDPA